MLILFFKFAYTYLYTFLIQYKLGKNLYNIDIEMLRGKQRESTKSLLLIFLVFKNVTTVVWF